MLARSFFLIPCLLFAESISQQTLSEALGHLIGKQLLEQSIELDLEAVAKGIEDEAQGVASTISPELCLQWLEELETQKLKEQREENLKQANAFFAEKETEAQVYFEILQKGLGDSLAPYNRPYVRYKIGSLNGPFSPPQDEIFTLDELMPGLKEGMVGMAEGEKRRIYIHPDLAYHDVSKEGPNALVVFEIELLKTDVEHASPSFPPEFLDPSVLSLP